MRNNGDPFAEEFIREIERENLAKAEELIRRQKAFPSCQVTGPIHLGREV
jgi:hypothetical protein